MGSKDFNIEEDKDIDDFMYDEEELNSLNIMDEEE
jgi:hypothetical protein